VANDLLAVDKKEHKKETKVAFKHIKIGSILMFLNMFPIIWTLWKNVTA